MKNIIRKSLMHDLQKKLNLHLSTPDYLAAMGGCWRWRGSNHERSVVFSEKDWIAKSESMICPQHYRELKPSWRCINKCNPSSGSLQFDRDKRRQIRDVPEELKTKLVSQKDDRDIVRALKKLGTSWAQIQEQEEEMEKVRTVWSLALDGIQQKRCDSSSVTEYNCW